MDSPRWAQFDVKVVTYKTVYKHEIQTYILVPKNIAPGPHPIIVKIHGGGSVSRRFRNLSRLVCSISHNPRRQNSAVLVLPNYRLLPESTAPEMISDITDFWTWLRSPAFTSALPSNITPDHAHTLVYGDSAGGHLAIHSALTEPENSIQACIAAYPQTDLEDPWFITAFEKHPFGAPMLPAAILDDHLAAMNPDPEKRELFSDTVPHDRLELILVAMQQGRYREMFGEEEHVYPFRVLERVAEEKKGGKGRKMPYLWLYHGEKDSVLPVEGSEKFAKKWTEAFGEEGLKLHVEKGADHGFDGSMDVDVPWIKEGLEGTVKAWLE